MNILTFLIQKKYIIMIIIFILVILAFTYKYNSLNNRYEDMKAMYHETYEKYVIANANNTVLKNALDTQNLQITEYKIKSSELENKVETLNKTIHDLDSKDIEYIHIEQSIENKSEIQADEAVEWLKQQSKSLF